MASLARLLAPRVSLALLKYSPNQPRDENGRWTERPSLESLFADNLGTERAHMPQVPAGFRPAFVAELKAAGIGVKAETVDARSLKPTQKDYKRENIEHLRREDEAGNWGSKGRTHIMVSREGRVLDGHHRWAFKAQDNKTIDVLRVDAPIRDLLDRALVFNAVHGIERRTVKASLAGLLLKYDPNQPRDERGRWTDGGGSGPAEMTVAQFVPRRLIESVESLTAAHQGHEEDAADLLSHAQRERAAAELAPRIALAHEAKPAYDDKLQAIGKDLGARVMVAPVKGGSRLLEKHVLENASDPNNMRDLVRGSLVVNNASEAARALERIKSDFEVTRLKDRFANPLPTGYRDMLVNVRLPNGIEAEIQVHIPQMIAAKQLGHKVYDIERRTAPGPEKSAMIRLQSEIYNAAYQNSRARERVPGF